MYAFLQPEGGEFTSSKPPRASGEALASLQNWSVAGVHAAPAAGVASTLPVFTEAARGRRWAAAPPRANAG